MASKMMEMRGHGKIIVVDCFRPKMDPNFFFLSLRFEDGTLWEVVHDPDYGYVPWEASLAEWKEKGLDIAET